MICRAAQELMGRRFAAQAGAGGKTSSSRPYLFFSLAIAVVLLERRAGQAASALWGGTGPHLRRDFASGSRRRSVCVRALCSHAMLRCSTSRCARLAQRRYA